MPDIVRHSACDTHAVESLLDAAFGEDRKHRTAYMLRDGMTAIGALSFGLAADAALIGSIQCWPVEIVGDDDIKAVPLILVGPVAVHPQAQNKGHGQMLMEAMLKASIAEGNPPLVMIGDAEYYGRFGFSARANGRMGFARAV